ERGCSVTEIANYENVGKDCGNLTIALDSTEKTTEGTKKKTINWDLDGKDWFLFGESGANYVSSILTLNCWLCCENKLADVVGCRYAGNCLNNRATPRLYKTNQSDTTEAFRPAGSYSF
ncbi:hypothetical protein AVEN_62023-1, partial [Araneus ventricosus]